VEGIAQGEDGGQAVSQFAFCFAVVGVFSIIALTLLMLVCGLRMGGDRPPARSLRNSEAHFWANKCHEAFNEAQRAYGLEDWYSFHKFCDQHALYYRRYQMARDGHFERKT
jgi:hypothetical protein